MQFEGTEIALDSRVGIFITMNPGYAGRTELPESVKALFRPVVVIVPDMQQICEIMLFSEGFLMAKVTAQKFQCTGRGKEQIVWIAGEKPSILLQIADVGEENDCSVQTGERAAVEAVSLRLRAASLEVGARDGGRTEARLTGSRRGDQCSFTLSACAAVFVSNTCSYRGAVAEKIAFIGNEIQCSRFSVS